MASDTEFVEFIVDQLRDVKGVSCKKMFGEYAIYCGGKVVAMVCDNQLFVKPTAGGRAFIGEVVEGQPYPGVTPQFPDLHPSLGKPEQPDDILKPLLILWLSQHPD